MLTLTPAYGRDYKSKKAVLEDFNANKDFVAHSHDPRERGGFTNKPDLVKMGHKQVKIRYSQLNKVIVVEVK
jgi:hypothetical protein